MENSLRKKIIMSNLSTITHDDLIDFNALDAYEGKAIHRE